MTVEILKPKVAHKQVSLRKDASVHVPAMMEIDGLWYPVNELSAEGTALVTFDGQAEPGQLLPATIAFPLDGFDFSMAVTCEVKFHAPESCTLGLQFVQLAKSHQDLLRALFGSIAAGESVGAGDILTIVRQGKPKEKQNIPPLPKGKIGSRRREAFRRRIGAILFIILGISLLVFIVANIWARTFVVQADGMVGGRATVAQMPQAGELLTYAAATGTRVVPGSPIAMLRTKSGKLVRIASECDCVLGGQLAAPQTVLQTGDPIAYLVPVGGTNAAVLSVDLDDMRRIRVGDRVIAELYDSPARLVGTVERVVPPKIAGLASETESRGRIEVQFAQMLPPSRVGEPITARIRLSKSNPLS
jgi:alginate biosynthesis protein Alg44